MTNTLSTDQSVVTKATRKTIEVAGLEVEVFQLPDGSYSYSQTSAVKAIGRLPRSFGQFLAGKSPEASPYKGLSFGQVNYENHNIPINATPALVVAAYWTYWASKGNSQAIALTTALNAEALERRADSAFGVKKTEPEYELRAKDNLDIELSNWYYKQLEEYQERIHYELQEQQRIINAMFMSNESGTKHTRKLFKRSLARIKSTQMDIAMHLHGYGHLM